MEQAKDKIGNIPFEDASTLEKYLMQARYQLKPDLNQLQLQQSMSKILHELQSIHQNIHGVLSYYRDQPTTSEIVQSKLIMYYFQVLNLVMINLGPQHTLKTLQPVSIVKNLSIFSQIQSKISTSQSKGFKAFLIFYFNLLKRLSRQFLQREEIDYVFGMLKDALQCYFRSHSGKDAEKQVKFREQTQWMGFIFEVLPAIKWKSISQELSESFIINYYTFADKTLENQDSGQKCKYQILHMMGNFLHLVIQSRTTTQLIQNYECPIQDIKQMYSKPNKDKLCNIKLNKQDIQFLCEQLIQNYLKEKALFRHWFLSKEQSVKKAYEVSEEYLLSAEGNQVQQFDKNVNLCDSKQTDITIGDLLIEIINLLNSALFLGGYSRQLQTLIYNKLFQNHLLPEFLQFAYLIYNQRRFMGKHSIKITMAKPPDANFAKLLRIDYESAKKEKRQAIFKLIGQEIKYGQLSVLLRLMTNLIHINNQALGYFENNIKYLHMVMSLTHDSEMNLTMKNWAVLFIKNCCDSQLLRDEIGKIKIQMKVQE